MRSDVFRNDVINCVIVTENGNCKYEFIRRSIRQNMAALEAGRGGRWNRGCPCKDTSSRQASELPFNACSCEFELPTAGDVEWLLFSYT